ncbi:MAG: HNH endonuclease [Proteobacteria bacterium]|nr:HNH endonuclease [Pseudomonadota bacterium]
MTQSVNAAPAVRVAIPKRVRFDVFKRDGFQCQYCGAHPPGVLLHVDHIHPVALGGTNDPDNLVTACEPCNLGKGATDLTVTPQSLASKAAEVAEREAQVLGYHAVLQAKRERLDEEAFTVLRVMYGARKKKMPAPEVRSVRMFIEKTGFHEVLDAMELAVGRASGNPWLYFCGICWSKVREQEKKK